MSFDSQDASGIEKVIEAASRRVDQFCNRHFYSQTATKVFHGNGKGYMRISDLLAATTVKLDEGDDDTFEVTLGSTDYVLEREGHQDMDASPKTMIRLRTNGQRSSFTKSSRLLQIAGRWGFTEDTENLTPTGSLVGSSSTTLILSTTDDTLCTGQTLLYDNIEQVYVRSYNSAGPSCVVVRAVNGTPAQNSASKSLKRFVYLPDIVEATLEIASSLWKGRETGYVSSTITNPVIGSIDVFPGMPSQAKQLLMPYRIIPV